VVCKIHKVDFKLIPAGVSKKTGRPYPAFEVCPVEGCNEKPQAPLNSSDPLDMKILEDKENVAIDRDSRRSYRIERQHSQEMAIRTMEVLYKVDKIPVDEKEMLKWVKRLTDIYMEDLNADTAD